MKKMMMIAALTMLATPAFASKSRLNSLGSAAHLVDVQRTFDRPEYLVSVGELATVEAGSAGASTASDNGTAEGGFVRQMNENGYLGFYVGRKPAALQTVVSTLNSATSLAIDTSFLPLDNSLNLMYGAKAGDLNWGVNLFYMASNKKASYAEGAVGTVTNRKTDVMGLSAGVSAANWEVDAVIGLSGKAGYTVATAGTGTGTSAVAGDEVKAESKSNNTLRGAYKMDTMYYFGSYNAGSTTVSYAGTEITKLESNTIELGLIDSIKKDGSEFFYGVSYLMSTSKSTPAAGETKIETTTLPLVVGIEADAASWVVLRGSLKHNLPILGSTKTTTPAASGESDTISGQTTAAAGLGLKFNKFTVDASAAAATSGNIGFNAPDFLTTASLTYMF
jgi:hypothetical protein